MKTGPPDVHISTPTFFRKYGNKAKWHNPYRCADGFCGLYLITNSGFISLILQFLPLPMFYLDAFAYLYFVEKYSSIIIVKKF